MSFPFLGSASVLQASPVVIDQPGQNRFKGPFPFNGALYAVGNRTGANTQSTICKSVDGGVTWIAQDDANGPLSFLTNRLAFDAPNGLIHCLFRPNAGFSMSYMQFDMNTDTYGAVVDSGIPIGANLVLVLRSTGSLIAFYNPNVAVTLPQDLIYIPIAAYAFGAPVIMLVAGAAPKEEFIPLSFLLYPDDTIRVIYEEDVGFPPVSVVSRTLKSITLDPANVVGATDTLQLSPEPVLTNPADKWEVGPCLIFQGNRLIVPNQRRYGKKMSFFEGTPIAAPVWTLKDVHGSLQFPADWKDEYPTVVEFTASLIYFFFCVTYLPADLADAVVSVFVASYDGATIQDPPETFWDELANPVPAAVGLNPDDYYLLDDSVYVENGVFKMVVEAAINQDLEAGLVYLAVSSLVIICDNPPVGIVGTLYVHVFPVEGGIPPYGFAITAGSLPPGLVLDVLTGEVSGSPTVNGIFPFTIQVTDSLGATAEAECSITVRKRCILVDVA